MHKMSHFSYNYMNLKTWIDLIKTMQRQKKCSHKKTAQNNYIQDMKIFLEKFTTTRYTLELLLYVQQDKLQRQYTARRPLSTRSYCGILALRIMSRCNFLYSQSSLLRHILRGGMGLTFGGISHIHLSPVNNPASCIHFRSLLLINAPSP